MRTFLIGTILAGAAAFVATSCATSPEVEARYRASEDRIAAIFGQAAETPELGPAERCLGELEIRNFRPLDDRYILFEGQRGKQWINQLHMRCFDLEYAQALRVRSFSMMRMCEFDSFMPGDWFDWPWYRRWPWHWGGWPTGSTCTLGKFHPVSEEHVLAIEAAIRSR
ncbi:MAG: DUF6491 family protein [Gammaproteobacteria bacterium]|nr:DUF6491 family protein [Gammaproteobacteria bacterium]MDH5310915.1 DUF6491 family protein [Gammaproteobacteria bacterium]